jgi:solute carrier family 25 (mitochondrial folate transporter), member 32
MSARRGVSVLELSSAEFLAASGIAGVATAVCTNPIWVVKTRMLITDRSSMDSYKSLLGRNPSRIAIMADGIRQIFRTEGVRGFYSGLTPSLIGVSHGAVQFMFYEELKKWRIRQKRGSANPKLVCFGFSAFLICRIMLSGCWRPYYPKHSH